MGSAVTKVRPSGKTRDHRVAFYRYAVSSSLRIAPHRERCAMDCRPHCGACCTAPSISSPIPGMPHGKPAGVPCVQLQPDSRCALFGKPERPAVCVSLRPHETMCGPNREVALRLLGELETATAP